MINLTEFNGLHIKIRGQKQSISPILLGSIQYNTINTIYRYCPAFSGVTHLF